LSARPFWVLFTICIMVLIQWLMVPRVVDYVISKEIVSMGVPVREALAKVDAVDMQLPSSAKPDDLLTRDSLQNTSLTAKFGLLYSRDARKAISYVLGLIITGILAGFLFASVAFRHLVRFGDRLTGMSSTDKLAVIAGVIVGLLISALLLPNILSYFSGPGPILGIIIMGTIVYACIWAMMSMRDEFRFYFPSESKVGDAARSFEKPKILDTNVIIDGRVADVCRTGFIDGQILVPSFVLEELQHIADSPDGLRRARGRRGLDILNAMRKELDLVVRQSPAVDPANPDEVDSRLVKLAKEIEGCIVTNDFNLNKVAELQGVMVLNINELANALKPVVLPGEELRVQVIKEGKEASQGVAYLDDGTMVVVEGAKTHIGETVEAVVTSVLQTVAGKMIFANLKSVQEEEDDLIDRNVRNYSGFRGRKKT
jgi:uncharacterized protein YacL